MVTSNKLGLIIFALLFSSIKVTNSTSLKEIAVAVQDKTKSFVNGASEIKSNISKIKIRDVGSTMLESLGSGVRSLNNVGQKSLNASRNFENAIFDFSKHCREKATNRELVVYSLAAFGGGYLTYKAIQKIHAAYNLYKNKASRAN